MMIINVASGLVAMIAMYIFLVEVLAVDRPLAFCTGLATLLFIVGSYY